MITANIDNFSDCMKTNYFVNSNHEGNPQQMWGTLSASIRRHARGYGICDDVMYLDMGYLMTSCT